MKRKDRLLIKTLVNCTLVLLGTLVLILFLRQMQNNVARNKQYEDSISLLDRTVSTISKNESDAAELIRVYHSSNRQTLKDLKKLSDSGVFNSIMDAEPVEQAAQFRKLVNSAGVDYMFFMDGESTIVFAPNYAHMGLNLRDLKILTPAQLSVLTSGSEEVVQAETDRGRFCFYAQPVISNGQTYYIVLGQHSDVLDAQYESLTAMEDVLGAMSTNQEAFLFAVDNKAGTFLYFDHDGHNLTGQDAVAAGLTEKLMKDGASGDAAIAGTRYYCVTRAYNDTTVIGVAVASDSLYDRNTKVVFWAATIFIMVLVVTLLYSLILRRDLLRRNAPVQLRHVFGSRITLNKTVADKIIPITVTGLVFIFGVTYYTQTLLALSKAINSAGNTLNRIESQLAENDETRKNLEDYYYKHYLSKARLISFVLESDPSALNEATTKVHTLYNEKGLKQTIADDEGNPLRSVSGSSALEMLCSENDLKAIYVYNEQGYTIATNTGDWYFTLSLNPEDQSYAFRNVLDGKLDSYVQTARINDLGQKAQYIGTAFTYYTTLNESGKTQYVSSVDYQNWLSGSHQGNPVTEHRSLLQVELDPEVVGSILNSTDISYQLDYSNIVDEGFLAAFDDTADHLLVYSPNGNNIGKSAAELGVTSVAFSDDYNGFQTINGIQYFTSYRYSNGYYVAICTPTHALHKARLPVAFIAVIVSLIVLCFVQGLFLFSTEEEEDALRELAAETNDAAGGSTEFTVTLPNGEKRSNISAISRWSRQRFSWDKKTPEQKLMTLIRFCGIILVMYLILALLLKNRFFAEGSIINYIISGTWDKSFNIFALSRCILLFLTLLVGVSILNYLTRTITSMFGARTETVGHLLTSVVKYGSALSAIFYSLYLIGFDSVSLLTSAGILSVVVGLGAQSLISDIVAGIFIVFEGEFRVGDIVTIGDTRGTVLEIGIRTTKVADSLQNIKIYNNSTISSVLNMTKKSSIATCTLSIAYGESIERVESVLAFEFPRIREKLPAIIEGPFYKGISALNSSSVDLLITAKCLEGDRLQLARDLNREMFIICGKYDINIPFPQVTVSYLDEDYEKQKSSSFVQQYAEKFVNTQKEAGKDANVEPQ